MALLKSPDQARLLVQEGFALVEDEDLEFE